MEDDMDVACSTHGRKNKCILDLHGKPEGRNHLEDLSIEGKILK
jgi:hypothetical protein